MTAFQISTIHILRAAKLLQRQKNHPKSSTELKKIKKTHKTNKKQSNKQTKSLKEKPQTTTPKHLKTKFDPFIIIMYKFLEFRFQEISFHLGKVKKISDLN